MQESLMCSVSCILTVTALTHSLGLQFGYIYRYRPTASMYEISKCKAAIEILNNDQSASLIPRTGSRDYIFFGSRIQTLRNQLRDCNH